MIKNIINFLKKLSNFNFNAAGIKNDINTKIQKAENYSEKTNITIYNHSLSYDDIKIIAFDVFKANFPKLEKIARETANNRINEFLEKIIPLINNSKLNKFRDVDTQYDFNKVLKTVALRGNENINDLLAKILLNKLNSNNNFDSIVLSSVIDKISKISTEELNLLGSYTLTINKKFNDMKEHTISQLLTIDKKRCHEYCSSLASNGLIHWTGGFAKYPDFIQDNGIRSNYIKEINEILKENVFINLELLQVGEIIAENYLEVLNNLNYNEMHSF